jgi:hypothetical protein
LPFAASFFALSPASLEPASGFRKSASAAAAARRARSVSPRISSKKRLGIEGRFLPHLVRPLAKLSVNVVCARVTPT